MNEMIFKLLYSSFLNELVTIVSLFYIFTKYNFYFLSYDFSLLKSKGFVVDLKKSLSN